MLFNLTTTTILALIFFSPFSNAATQSYIIKFKAGVLSNLLGGLLNPITNILALTGLTNVIRITQSYNPQVFNGIAVEFDDSLLQEVKAKLIPYIEYIEDDKSVQTFSLVRQYNPYLWNLPRISQSDSGGGAYYSYDSKAGLGVTAYVVDTGINVNHADFQGRAYLGASFVSGKDSNDEHGHGTHCAGIIGGYKYGVAKKSILVAVRVLDADGSGKTSQVMAGINWVVQDCYGKCIMLISSGGSYSSSLNTAINNAFNLGVLVVVASGNSNVDACNTSPASAAYAMSVGASDDSDDRAYYSNYGNCVDLYAPGSSITSAWLGQGSYTLTGTSMAAPHVAGIAALVMSVKSISNSQLLRELISMGTSININEGGSYVVKKLAQNKILY